MDKDDIPLQSHVPIDTTPKGGRTSVYPFKDMKVGDSFTLDAKHNGCMKSTEKANPRVALAAHKHGKRHGWQFTYTTHDDGSVTVWRVA